jgi:FkbM family methyltransferase
MGFSRSEFYKTSLQNLGLLSLVRMQLQRKFAKKDEMLLTSKMLAHPVIARRNTSDITAFHQVFVAREYGCVDHVIEPRLIVDCGANVGYSSAYFLSRFPRCSIVAIEPDQDNYAVLQRNVYNYKNRCRTIQRAVWWRQEILHFKQPPVRGSEWGRAVGPLSNGNESVSSLTIPMLLKSAPSPRISILKIDIEGAEEELFSHDTEWLDSVDYIVIELHNDDCRRAFFKAVDPWIMKVTTCGELTCCTIKHTQP